MVGTFAGTPAGIILHGTRSSLPYTQQEEFDATVRYVRAGAGGLGWHVTVGPDMLAEHMPPDRWGWNARGASSRYLAIEFAQASQGGVVLDSQLRAAAWWIWHSARKRWPGLPLTATSLVNHSDLPEGIADGKTDVQPRGQHSVRDRLLKLLET